MPNGRSCRSGGSAPGATGGCSRRDRRRRGAARHDGRRHRVRARATRGGADAGARGAGAPARPRGPSRSWQSILSSALCWPPRQRDSTPSGQTRGGAEDGVHLLRRASDVPLQTAQSPQRRTAPTAGRSLSPARTARARLRHARRSAPHSPSITAAHRARSRVLIRRQAVSSRRGRTALLGCGTRHRQADSLRSGMDPPVRTASHRSIAVPRCHGRGPTVSRSGSPDGDPIATVPWDKPVTGAWL